MINKVLEKIKKYDGNQKEVFRIARWNTDLANLLEFIIDYFELNKVLKDKFHDDFDYPKEHKYLEQTHELLNYIEFLLRQIKPFIPLAYELSQDYVINEKFTKGEIREKSIMKMIRNFIELKRTGRKRIYYHHEKEKFKEFKKTYSKVLSFCKHIDSFDGKTTGSILDHARAIREFKIEKVNLRRYKLESQHWIRKCSKATKYRFDKDIFIVENFQWDIKKTLKNYDFWVKCLEDYEKKKKKSI